MGWVRFGLDCMEYVIVGATKGQLPNLAVPYTAFLSSRISNASSIPCISAAQWELIDVNSKRQGK